MSKVVATDIEYAYNKKILSTIFQKIKFESE